MVSCTHLMNLPILLGDVIYLNLLGQPMVILNAAEDAIALLEKRGNIYSDRPIFMMGGEMVGWKYILGLTPYGDRFRMYRKFIAKFVGGRAQVEKHLELQEYETKGFLKRILKDPEHVSDHIRRCVYLSYHILFSCMTRAFKELRGL